MKAWSFSIPDPPFRSRDLSIRLAICFLVAAGCLVYANSLSVPFLYDDTGAIVDNPDIRQLWPPAWAMPTTAQHAPTNSRPVVSFSLALNYALGALEPSGFRLFNIAVHLLCGLALFGVVRRTLLSPVLNERFGPAALPLAFAASLLWLVHPFNSQCVDYTIQRSESLMALFYLLALYCAIRRFESGRKGWVAVAVLACALGMASKESMATAPVMILLYDRVFWSGGFVRAWRRNRGLYLGLAATWGVLAFLMHSWPHKSSIGFATQVTAWQYLLNQCWVVVAYLEKLFWPHSLVVDYGFPLRLSLRKVLPQAALLLTLLGIAVYCLRRWPGFGFLGAWFFVLLAPTSSLIPIVNEVGADRRAYLPGAAFLVFVAVLGYFFAGRFSSRRKWAAPALTAVAAAVLGYGTLQRNQEYADPPLLWRIAVEAVPFNPRGHTYLGLALEEEGRMEDAAAEYQRALQLDPGYFQAHLDYGILLAEQGRLDPAEQHLRRALELMPGQAETHNNLGNVLLIQGRTQEAVDQFRRAIELDPEYAEAHNNLGIALATAGRLSPAIQQFLRALQLDPEYARAHYNLGIAFLNAGRREMALQHLRKALEIQSDLSEARRAIEEAIEEIERNGTEKPNP